MDANKKIVVIRQLGGIGDILMMSPVFLGLKERFPSSEVHLVTSREYMDGAVTTLAQRNPYIDIINDDFPITKSTTQDIIKMNSLDVPDILDDPYVANSYITIDLNTPCLAYEMAHPEAPKHRTDIWCDVSFVNPSSRVPIYRVTNKERVEAASCFKRDKPLVGIGLGAKDPARELPKELVHRTLALLRASGCEPVTFDTRYGVDGYLSVVGQPLRKVIAMVAQMDAFIAADSGLLHIAGSQNVPLVGLFGSVPHEARMKYYNGVTLKSSAECAPCWYSQPCLITDAPYKCMSVFSEVQIVENVLRLLKTKQLKQKLDVGNISFHVFSHSLPRGKM